MDGAAALLVVLCHEPPAKERFESGIRELVATVVQDTVETASGELPIEIPDSTEVLQTVLETIERTVQIEVTEEVIESVPDTVLAVTYSHFVPLLVKALQEQQAQIDDLTRRVAALEAAAADPTH